MLPGVGLRKKINMGLNGNWPREKNRSGLGPIRLRIELPINLILSVQNIYLKQHIK